MGRRVRLGVTERRVAGRELAGTFGSDREVDRALGRYRSKHRRALAAHHWLICDYATGRRLNPVERMLYGAATRDQHVARAIVRLAGRMATPQRVLTPALIARAGWVSARMQLRKASSA